MPKFYVRSKSLSFVVAADDIMGAALLVMNRLMASAICNTADRKSAIEGVLDQFGFYISVNQRGIWHCGPLIKRSDVYKQWKELF